MSAVAKAESSGGSKEPTRTAVILHDGSHVFVLKTARQVPAFPQHLIEDPLRIEDSAALRSTLTQACPSGSSLGCTRRASSC